MTTSPILFKYFFVKKPLITPISTNAIKENKNNNCFRRSSLSKETNKNGINGMAPMKTKDKNVIILAYNGYFVEKFISTKLLYLEIPMENPSAHKFANPNTRAYFVDIFAPIIPAIMAEVVMTPSIPP
tara:strand:- start:566 stop:949 length:384 start_codon:yes stop_codon:yes gene_type:complete